MGVFNVRGTIIRVIDNKFLIKVDDNDQNTIATIKEVIKDTNQSGQFISINFKKAKFEIKNFDWKEPTDLIGVHVAIRCDYTQRNIRQKINTPTDSNESNNYERIMFIPEYIHKQVISYSARVIQNIQ